MVKIKKFPLPVSNQIQKPTLFDDCLNFSFSLFDFKHPKFNFTKTSETYLEKFIERLKIVSEMKINEFRSNKNKSLRAHIHSWEETSEPSGFANLNEQLKQYEAWQFQISANEHGRVHGILIDNIFYVIWLDPDHLLYMQK